MKPFSIVFILCITVLVFSCSKHRPAPVKDYSSNKVSKVRSYSKIPESIPKFIKVRKGDTLYSIGFGLNMNYKEIAKLNNIKAPYTIFPGQKLKLIETGTPKTSPTKTSINIAGNKNNSTVKTTAVKIKPKLTPINPIGKPQKNNTTVNTSSQQSPNINKAIANKAKNDTAKLPKANNIKKEPKPTHVKPITKSPRTNSHWIWPTKGRLLSSFSQNDSSRKGIDISAIYGSPVLASNNGIVVYSGDGLRGYGELIIVKHDNNLLSAYAHNSMRYVKEGDIITQGQKIAASGKSVDGKSLLHFEIRKNGKPVNPINYLPKK